MNNNNQKKRPIRTVSFADLEHLGFTILVQEFTKELDNGHEKPAVKVVRADKNGIPCSRQDMQELLYSFGIDTKGCKWWVVPKTTHRCMHTKEPVYNYRYMGYERLDPVWVRSGLASEEAIMRSSRMGDMVETTNKMKRGGDSE